MKNTCSLPRIDRALVAFLLAAIIAVVASPSTANADDPPDMIDFGRGFVENTTVSAYQRFIAKSNLEKTGRYVILWCVYIDGQPLIGPSYDPEFQAPHPAASRSVWLYYDKGVVSRWAEAQTSPGCWTPVLADRSNGIDITFNTSMWANGPHTIKIEATANDDTKHSKTIALISKNSEPTIEWTTTPPIERTPEITPEGNPEMTLEAKITPSVDRIVKMCLTRHDTDSDPGKEVPYRGTHSSETGCTNVGTYEPLDGSIKFKVDTKSWPSQAFNLTLTVEDQVLRKFKTSLRIPAVNHRRNLTPIGIGTDLNGWVTIRQNIPATHKVFYKQVCVQAVNTESCATPTSSGFTGGTVAVNTACLANGSHIATMKATTGSGEEITESFDFTTRNSKPHIKKVTNSVSSPSWRNPTASSLLGFTHVDGCSYTVRLTGGSINKRYQGMFEDNYDDVALTKLKPQTTYTAKITVLSPHGTHSVTRTFTTSKVAPRPQPSTGTGNKGNSGGGGGGGGGYVFNYVGQRLSSVPGYYRRTQASLCSLYGYENGFFGIWNESNWIVVAQSGLTVYACKT